MKRLERVVDSAETAAKRLERPLLIDLERYLRVTERRILGELERIYRAELTLGKDQGRVFREGRARTILAQLQAYLAGLEPERIPLISGSDLAAAFEQGYESGLELLKVYETPTFFRPILPTDAVEMQVKNSAYRLRRHSAAAIDSINQAVVDGLVRGRSSQVVMREIRRNTDLLTTRATSIAITELGQARADAREAFYDSQGVDLVQRFVTQDERTCGTCAPRHGEITERSKTKEKLHVRCRDYLAPVRKEWLELGLVDLAAFKEQRQEILAGLKARGTKVRRGPAPFEDERPNTLYE